MRAPFLPTVSMSQAAFIVSRRACSISMRLSAMRSWTTPWSASGLPNATRPCARSHINVERALGETDRPHAVVDAPRPESRLRDREAAAFLAEQVLGRHAHVLEQRLAVTAAGVVPKTGSVRTMRNTGRVERHEDHRVPVVRVRVGVGDAHEGSRTQQRGDAAPLVNHLCALIDVVVAVALDAARDVRRVAARHPRLGHREARADLAVEQGLEELLLLERRAELGEDLHVPGVGCGAVRRFAEQRVGAHQLAERCVLDVGEAGAEPRVGQEEVPEAALLRLGLELLHHRRVEVRVTRLRDLAGEDGGRRRDVLVDERLQLRLELDRARAQVEVHPGTL